MYNPYFASHAMNCQHFGVYRHVFSQHYDYLKFLTSSVTLLFLKTRALFPFLGFTIITFVEHII